MHVMSLLRAFRCRSYTRQSAPGSADGKSGVPNWACTAARRGTGLRFQILPRRGRIGIASVRCGSHLATSATSRASVRSCAAKTTWQLAIVSLTSRPLPHVSSVRFLGGRLCRPPGFPGSGRRSFDGSSHPVGKNSHFSCGESSPAWLVIPHPVARCANGRVALSANITIAVIVLLTTVYVKTGRWNSNIFPSVLLATTLCRLC